MKKKKNKGHPEAEKVVLMLSKDNPICKVMKKAKKNKK